MEIRNLFRHVISSKHFPKVISETAILSLVTGYVFYKSVVGMGAVFLVSLFFIKGQIQNCEKIERQKKAIAFVDLLHVVRRLTASGVSIQSCFQEAQKELMNLYPDESSWIIESLADLNNKLTLDPYPGPYIEEWGDREEIKDISDFGKVIGVIHEFGGNMAELIGETALSISQRIETESHIWVLASSKIFEQKILFYLGYAMVMLLNFTMPDLILVLYTTFMGRCVMTLSLLLMLAGKSIGMRLTRIEV